MNNISEIVIENKRRNALLDAPYDPIKGTGGPLFRFRFSYPDYGIDIYIPKTMCSDYYTSHILKYNSFQAAAGALALSADDLFKKFTLERFKHDFEFWAATTIKILHKDLFIAVPFVLRKVQRKLLFELEIMRTANVPIRIVLLKARQWGGSTLVQIYMMWIQQVHRTSWHLAVCAQDDNAARNISSMYDTAARHYPSEVAKISFRSHNKSSKNKKAVERDCIIGVGSVNNPDQFRSYNYAMCHLSEVAFFKDTLKRKAINLIASLKETVPDQPYTLVVEESTAQGLNYFYESWKKAVLGKTRYKAVFVAWWEIDRCRENLMVPVDEFVRSFSDYDKFLWSIGATLEGINWYNKHKADKGYQDWEMQAENPSNPEEAFQSTGQKVFPPSYILATRSRCEEPLLIGDVFGKTRIGEFALEDIHVENIPRGNLRLWKLPTDMKNSMIKNRFCAFADIGGTSSRADFSCIKLIDREPMIYGNDPEVVAVWHGHLDQDLFAWKCAQLCMAYSNPDIGEYPLLAFEIQSLKKEKVEGSHALTILDQIKDFYPNLYVRNDAEKVGDGFIPKYGWVSTHKEKGRIIDTLRGAMRENLNAQNDEKQWYGYVEKDERACDEMTWYEVKPDGSLGNVDGKHDDHVIITAGAVWLAVSVMDLPFVIREKVTPTAKKVRTYSSY